MLTRYKKSGGFLKLVKLLEGFGSEKRDKFLGLVEEEDRVWAKALKSKLLNRELIMSWDEQLISNIIQRMHEKNIAAMVHGLDEPGKTKIFALLGHADKRRLNSAVEEMKPTSGEITSAFGKLIEETREMISTGALRIDKFAPQLVIEEDIEEKLSSSEHFDPDKGGLDFGMAEHLGGGAAALGGLGPVDTKAYDELKRKVINLQKEVNSLRKDNKVMSEKLVQIKKIA